MRLYHSYISLAELYENVTKRYLAVCIELEFLVSLATSMVTLPGLVLTENSHQLMEGPLGRMLYPSTSRINSAQRPHVFGQRH